MPLRICSLQFLRHQRTAYYPARRGASFTQQHRGTHATTAGTLQRYLTASIPIPPLQTSLQHTQEGTGSAGAVPSPPSPLPSGGPGCSTGGGRCTPRGPRTDLAPTSSRTDLHLLPTRPHFPCLSLPQLQEGTGFAGAVPSPPNPLRAGGPGCSPGGGRSTPRAPRLSAPLPDGTRQGSSAINRLGTTSLTSRTTQCPVRSTEIVF